MKMKLVKYDSLDTAVVTDDNGNMCQVSIWDFDTISEYAVQVERRRVWNIMFQARDDAAEYGEYHRAFNVAFGLIFPDGEPQPLNPNAGERQEH